MVVSIVGISSNPQTRHWEGASIYDWRRLIQELEKTIEFPHPVDITLVRHGESFSNARNLVTGKHDSSLTKKGREQAQTLRNALSKNCFDYIFCSSLNRAKETMEIALSIKAHDDEILLDARLDERGLGVLEGNSARYIPEFAAGDLDFAPEGGESYRNLAARCLSFLVDLRQLLYESDPIDGETFQVLVFSHMGPLRMFDALITGDKTAKGMMNSSFKNSQVYQYHLERISRPAFLNQ